MKLYTEEQVQKLINGYYDVNWIIQDAFDELTPIELPSDDEIKEAAPYVPVNASMDFWANQEGFIDGAKWMKEQILNQNK